MPTADNTKRVNAIVILDAQGLIAGVDAGISDALNYATDALIGRPVETLITEVVGDQSEGSENASIHQRLRNIADRGEHKARVLRSNGESTALTLSVNEIAQKDDRQLLVTLQSPARSEFEKWITRDWYRVFNAAERASNEFLQAAYAQAPIATAICDLGGRFISVNAAMCELTGYAETELLSMYFADITHPDDIRPHIASEQQALQDNQKTYSLEKRYIHKSGKIVWAVLVVSLVNDKSGSTSFTVGSMIDLDKDQATGERLKWAYEQRNNLVREVHHRIKNNLQSVTGLLRRHIYANPAASDTLRQAISQVEAIAVVHGLESSAGNRRIRICDILCGIIAEANKLQTETDSIKYPTVLERPALVRSAEAVPIALILSELLTNAIKHHCPLHALDIRIAIERNKPDVVRIAISNPAQALPPEFNFADGKGIGQGLKLVRAMMPREDMRISFDYRNGDMSVTITLSPPIIYADEDSVRNESPNTFIGSVIK